jgi:hypothetical protein
MSWCMRSLALLPSVFDWLVTFSVSQNAPLSTHRRDG